MTTPMKPCEKFNAAVEAFIRSIGGKKIGEKPRCPGLEKCGPEFAIQTVAGELTVHPAGDWIACRFQDVEAAKRLLSFWPKEELARLNGFSGKWNFTDAQGGRFHAESNLKSFKRELKPLLPKERGGCTGRR